MSTLAISNTLLAKLTPKDREYDVRDSRVKGFMVRVQASGNMSYVVQYARGRRLNLGRVGILTPSEAREKAVKILADYAKGLDPKQAKTQEKGTATLKEFLDEKYASWVKAHNRSGSEAIKMIERNFAALLNRPLNQIKVQDIENWRTKKLQGNNVKAYAQILMGKKGKPTEKAKKHTIYIYRGHNPEFAFARVVHRDNFSETLNLSKLAIGSKKKSRLLNFLDALPWPQKEIDMQLPINLHSHLMDLIISNCKHLAMKPNTINRAITPLRSAISKAVEWGIIKEHGLSGLKPLKYDDSRVRYLSSDEKTRLFVALREREEKLKKRRARANTCRQKRGQKLHSEIGDDNFADYLLPMITITLNTGVRRIELFQLKREHINLEQGTLFVEKSKNYLARHIPLNKTAVKTLKIWIKQTACMDSDYLFPSPLDPKKPMGSVKKAWMNLIRERAKIKNFHWHDLRHDFASHLVMKEVSLYAVQKLMGHQKIDQTMKYAHLAPDFIAESVGRLD